MTPKAPLLVVTLFALLAHAGDEGLVKSISVDLNGDGKPEALSVEWDEGRNQFILKVGGATVRGSAGGEEPQGLTVVDIDGSDKRKEVAVHTGLTDYDKKKHLYAFDGKGLKELGSVPDFTEVRGNGIILSDSWQGFWNRRDKFVLDARKGKVSEVPQELYSVGVEATVKQSFPISRSRTDKTPVANLAQGSKIQVVAASPASGKGGNYLYLVKSSTGLLGWVTERELADKTEGLPFAG